MQDFISGRELTLLTKLEDTNRNQVWYSHDQEMPNMQGFISGREFILLTNTKLEDTNRNQVPVMAKRCRICRASFSGLEIKLLTKLHGTKYKQESKTVVVKNCGPDCSEGTVPGTSFVGVSFIFNGQEMPNLQGLISAQPDSECFKTVLWIRIRSDPKL